MNESKNLEYLSKVFEGLSVEKKDYVLHTARSLLEIQDNNACIIPAVDDVLRDERKKRHFQAVL